MTASLPVLSAWAHWQLKQVLDTAKPRGLTVRYSGKIMSRHDHKKL
jgi:hypothetical protein